MQKFEKKENLEYLVTYKDDFSCKCDIFYYSHIIIILIWMDLNNCDENYQE